MDEELLETISVIFGIILILFGVSFFIGVITAVMREKAQVPYERYLTDYHYVDGHEYDVVDEGDYRYITIFLEKDGNR